MKPPVESQEFMDKRALHAKQDANEAKAGCVVLDREKYANFQRKQRTVLVIMLVLYAAAGYFFGYYAGFEKGLLSSDVCSAIVEGAKSVVLR